MGKKPFSLMEDSIYLQFLKRGLEFQYYVRWNFLLLVASNFPHLSFIQSKKVIGRKCNLVVRSPKNNVL